MTIAVTYTGADDKHNNYAEWLRSDNGENAQQWPRPKVFTLSERHNNLPELQQCSGLLLSGGIDVHPNTYGGADGYPQQPLNFNPDRDAFETDAFKNAMALGMPVLGVCRGLQLINCILGGTLHQDLGSLGNAVHQFHHYDKVHGINIEPNTQLHTLVGYARSVVNSAHHQAINQLGHHLRSNCHSDDGIIEGIEWQDPENHPFMMAVQWHPERMYKLELQHSPLSAGLRQHFLTAVHQYHNQHDHN